MRGISPDRVDGGAAACPQRARYTVARSSRRTASPHSNIGLETGDWYHKYARGNWLFGGALDSITVDPRDANHWFITDFFAIYQTHDAGKTSDMPTCEPKDRASS